MYRSKNVQLAATILVVGVVAFMFVTGMTFTLLKLSVFDEVSFGYEGAKLFFEGLSKEKDEGHGLAGFVFRVNDAQYPRPPQANSWSFNRGGFNVDPDDDAIDKLQNLLGLINTNGRYETFPNSNQPLKTSVEWDKTVQTYPNGSKLVKHVKAQAYFFLSQVVVETKVDEGFTPFFHSEKDGWWTDFGLVLVTHVNNWDPLGNKTSWARILGVEVASVQNKPVSKALYDELFAQGQMLPLYRSFEDAVGKRSALPSQRGETKAQNSVNEDLDPSGGDLVETGYVLLPYAGFGAKAALTDTDWAPPQQTVTLRIHVLKVDEWIAVQSVGSKFKPPTREGTESESGLTAFLRGVSKSWGDFWSNPWNALGVGGLVTVGLIVLVVVLLGAPILALLTAWVLRGGGRSKFKHSLLFGNDLNGEVRSIHA